MRIADSRVCIVFKAVVLFTWNQCSPPSVLTLSLTDMFSGGLAYMATSANALRQHISPHQQIWMQLKSTFFRWKAWWTIIRLQITWQSDIRLKSITAKYYILLSLVILKTWCMHFCTLWICNNSYDMLLSLGL